MMGKYLGEVLSVCERCEHCRSIEVDGYVDCDVGIRGKAKKYCRAFKPKG